MSGSPGNSDESGDSDFFNSSLSIWRGSKASLEGGHDPVHLDLHTASSIGNYDCVRMFINSDTCNLNAKNQGNWTPLMYAAYIGHDNIVNLLLDASVDVNLSNSKGHTPLMLAASCGNESVCYFLKEAGADMEANDKVGWTALFHATVNGHANIVKFLLEGGTDINYEEPKYGHTPLMKAAHLGHEIIVQLLINGGASLHVTSRTGETARSIAMARGHIKIVSLLDDKSRLGIRSIARLSEESSGSEDSGLKSQQRAHQRMKHRHKYNINEGPEALSRIMPHSQGSAKTSVTFKEPTVETQIPSSTDVPVKAMQNLTVDTPTVRQKATVSPIVKAPIRPENLHDLLVQLNLLKYEQIFTEQDVDLEVFLSMNDADLKEIGIKLFGPRRKMTHAISNWTRDDDADQDQPSSSEPRTNDLNNKLQLELKEKNWQLEQAFGRLSGFHSTMEHYHKELEHEKNIRSLTENYLLTEKSRIEQLLAQVKDTGSSCSKAVRANGKLKVYQQILKARHTGLEKGQLPSQLQSSLTQLDEAAKSFLMKSATEDTDRLWNDFQAALSEASKFIGIIMLNLQKIALPTEN